MKKFSILAAIIASVCFLTGCKNDPAENFIASKFDQYADSSAVNQMVFVFWYGHESDAEVIMFTREKGGKWQESLRCDGYVGQNGLSADRHEGDMTTPVGDFGIIESFGIKENPGTKLPYFVVEDHHWSCSDPEHYNKIIDIREFPHECTGEHLIDCVPAYNYAFFFDFNKECVIGKGNSIFFHCFGKCTYTEGCVAVSEENMIKIMQTIDMGARVIIADFSGRDSK